VDSREIMFASHCATLLKSRAPRHQMQDSCDRSVHFSQWLNYTVLMKARKGGIFKLLSLYSMKVLRASFLKWSNTSQT
jgi:hypothetical protein